MNRYTMKPRRVGVLIAAVILLAQGAALAAIVRPDHVVVVVMEDRFAHAIGDSANMPYTNNTLANGSLIYGNSHGLNTVDQEGQMNYLALYSGSTQGITDNNSGYSFSGPNLAKQLNAAGLSFTGFAESLPSNGDSTTQEAAQPGPNGIPDLYTRHYNPMAQFTDVGPGRTNADVNQTFDSYKSLIAMAGQFANLPTMSFIVPNKLHNTHGSDEAPPFATDPLQYNPLRQAADAWLQQNIDGYLQWAKTHNSLLIVTGDEGDRQHDFTAGTTTLVNGDPRLFIPGVNGKAVNPYNFYSTFEDMYGLTHIGDAPGAPALDTNAAGMLVAPEPSSLAAASLCGLLLLKRRRAE